jgi:hypothetical protein
MHLYQPLILESPGRTGEPLWNVFAVVKGRFVVDGLVNSVEVGGATRSEAAEAADKTKQARQTEGRLFVEMMCSVR